MNKNVLVRTVSPALAALLSTAVLAQAPRSETAADENGTAEHWQHPTTPWGDPDLRGMWPIGHLTGVPLQRPEHMGTRRYLTDQEIAEREGQYRMQQQAYDREIEQGQMGMGHWVEWGEVQRMTSLIVDPPNGRLPSLTAEGERRRAEMRSGWMDIPFDHWSDFDNWDRCITRSLPASMLPAFYNNGIEIIQAPGYVVIRLEMIHEARIIPIGDAEAVDPAIKGWLGYSRGRWEGDTLVVETRNFNGRGSSTNIHTIGAPPLNNTPLSEQYVLTERFTRTGDDTLSYSFTVHDPVVWEQPWTVEMPWKRDPSYKIYEYACHEGNTMIRYYIETSRAERAAQAADAS